MDGIASNGRRAIRHEGIGSWADQELVSRLDDLCGDVLPSIFLLTHTRVEDRLPEMPCLSRLRDSRRFLQARRRVRSCETHKHGFGYGPAERNGNPVADHLPLGAHGEGRLGKKVLRQSLELAHRLEVQ